jgi:hypothetical protein
VAIREPILTQRRSDHSWSEQLEAPFRVLPPASLSARFDTGPRIFGKNLGSALKSHNRLFIKSLRHNSSNRPVGLSALRNCVLSLSQPLTCVPGIRTLMRCDAPHAVYQTRQTSWHIGAPDGRPVNSPLLRRLLIEKRSANYQESISTLSKKSKGEVGHRFWWLRRLVISRICRVSNNLQLREALTQVLCHGGCLVKMAQDALGKVKHRRFLLQVGALQRPGGDSAGLILETAFAGVTISSPRQLSGMGRILATSLSPIEQTERLCAWVSAETTIYEPTQIRKR